jgi:iron(III) transport system substrate-binding protein
MLSENRARFEGKVSTYTPDNSEIGSIALMLDSTYDTQFWDLAGALGSCAVESLPSTSSIMDHVSSGQTLIAYDVVGSEAIKRAKRDPSVGIQFTFDYNLVLSRLIYIRKNSPHPNAAKLWLDYVLSRRGQQQMQIADLYPIRGDIEGVEPGVVMLRKAPGVVKFFPYNGKFAAAIEPARVAEFDSRWRRITQAGAQAPRPQ